MNLKDTAGLYITRKRKKWKFAHFDSYKNCFAYKRGADPKTIKTTLRDFFKKAQPLILEIAAGNAQFSLQLARLHPEYNFVAIDIKSDRLYTSAKQGLEEGIENIAFLRMHISGLSEVFSKNSVDTIWLTFPDPFPRKRSAKHRLSHVAFLQQYRNILKETGSLRFKTDNRSLFLWSLEQLVAQNWGITELSFDLHESSVSDECKITTYYEERFMNQQIPINYLRAQKGN